MKSRFQLGRLLLAGTFLFTSTFALADSHKNHKSGKQVEVKIDKNAQEKQVEVSERDARLMHHQGSLCFFYNVKNGVVYLGKVVVRGAKGFYEEVITPFHEVVIKDVLYGKVLRDGVYKMFLKPIGHGAYAVGKAVVSGTVKGAKFTYTYLIKGIVYDSALKPAGKGIYAGGKFVVRGVVKGVKFLFSCHCHQCQHQQQCKGQNCQEQRSVAAQDCGKGEQCKVISYAADDGVTPEQAEEDFIRDFDVQALL